MPFQPLVTQRLYQRVAEQIIELIRAKELPVGHRVLPERDLAKVLKVSRPVVREAMIVLEMMGLVEVRTGAGTFVKTATPAVAMDDEGPGPFDIISARILIEGEVAAVAADEATADDLAEIAAIHRTFCQEVADRSSTLESDRRFHEAIARATHNSALPGVVDGLWRSQFAPVFAALSRRAGLARNVADTMVAHGRVADALQRRDSKEARIAMHAHLEQVMGVLMRDDEELF